MSLRSGGSTGWQRDHSTEGGVSRRGWSIWCRDRIGRKTAPRIGVPVESWVPKHHELPWEAPNKSEKERLLCVLGIISQDN